MRLSTSEQRYCQYYQYKNKNISFAGARYLPQRPFCWFNNFDSLKQRATLGVAALVFQPIIDYCNPMTDKKTREFSVLKTVVKVVVGTISGLVVRGAAIAAITKALKKENHQKFLKSIKDSKLKEQVGNILKDNKKVEKFRDNLSTVVGLIGVAIGDFTIDMPLAKIAIEKTADVFGMNEKKDKEVKK